MGGSSLSSEVMSKTFKSKENFLKLHVLDSTDPYQIQKVEHELNLRRTLFIVSSKSGTTLEPNILFDYFFEKVKPLYNDDENIGLSFVAITDKGTPLVQLAMHKKFRKIFYGKADIGGRYSVLSNFGIVPMALMGINVQEFLNSTSTMVNSCKLATNLEEHPAARVGIILGECGLSEINKVTFICSENVQHLGLWLEQLLAESTGKEGKGLIPITGEPLTEPKYYSHDRIFIHIKVASDVTDIADNILEKLKAENHPVIRITLNELQDIGQEFFRWQMITAIAGSILKINPFNQPDVEESKLASKKITDEYERTGTLSAELPVYEEAGIQVFSSSGQTSHPNGYDSLTEFLKHELDDIKAGDYFGILAYLPIEAEYELPMQDMRLAVRDNKRIATCLEFGPRFLHSTGQIYKGGPKIGKFLELTTDHDDDLLIPGHQATFGIIEMAQAKGDLDVLSQKQSAFRIHIQHDIKKNLHKISDAVHLALSVR
jgi:transaldolase/glucose-6-phosphate isomerase